MNRLNASKPDPRILGQQDVLQWLTEFQSAITALDFAAARELFHPAIIAFGTTANRADHLTSLCEFEWATRWPGQRDFEFCIGDAKVMPAPGLFVVAVEWKVPSPIIGGKAKWGRSTFALGNFEGKLLCIHSHDSEAP